MQSDRPSAVGGVEADHEIGLDRGHCPLTRRRRRTRTALALLLVTAAVAAPLGTRSFAYDAAAIIEQLPRGYIGFFQWDGSAQTQQVAITFTVLQPLADDKVEARGCGRYDASGLVTEIRVKMQVDAVTLKFEMWELDPIGSAGFTTDGSHKGGLSSDLQRLDAEWETASTGAKGKLHLGAGPTISCGAPSARGPSEEAAAKPS